MNNTPNAAGSWHAIVLLAGGGGSGKTSLAHALCEKFEANARHVATDDYFLPAGSGAPTLVGRDGQTYVDINHPASIDVDAIVEEIWNDRVDTAPLTIVEGHLALAIPKLRELALLKLYLDVPSDVRLGRKIVRNHRDKGKDPEFTFLNYLDNARPSHETWIAPSSQHADVVLDGMQELAKTVKRVSSLVPFASIVG